jgi:hypothetical protein
LARMTEIDAVTRLVLALIDLISSQACATNSRKP